MKKLYKVVNTKTGQLADKSVGKKSEPAFFRHRYEAKVYRDELNDDSKTDNFRVFRGPDHRHGETDPSQ